MCLVAIGSRDDATRQRLHENFIQPIVSKVGGYDNPPDHINYARGKLNSNIIKAGDDKKPTASKFTQFRTDEWKSQEFYLSEPEDSSRYFR